MTTLAENRKARHDYTVLEKFEAGIVLQGTEVKSCREHNIALTDAYARVIDGELWLVNAHIAQYKQAHRDNHEPRRNRKLLLHKREIRRLAFELEAKGLTLVPLCVCLVRNRIKIEFGLCRGKRAPDKRQTLKKQMHDQEARRAVAAHR